MTKVTKVEAGLFNVPLAEVLSDTKHGDHTHFELITATVTLEDGTEGGLRELMTRTAGEL